MVQIQNVNFLMIARFGDIKVTGTLHYIPNAFEREPFDNYDLRMALKYSLKRQELVDKFWPQRLVTSSDFHSQPLPQFASHSVSLTQTRQLSTIKSGHSGVIQLSTSAAAFAGAVDAAQLIASSAAEAGINIEVVREQKDGCGQTYGTKRLERVLLGRSTN